MRTTIRQLDAVQRTLPRLILCCATSLGMVGFVSEAWLDEGLAG